LANVHPLVRPGILERGAVATEDDVPEGDRDSAATNGNEVFEHDGYHRPVDLEHSIDEADPTRHERGRNEQESDGGIGQRPEVPRHSQTPSRY
jgi:hypothetical protein